MKKPATTADDASAFERFQSLARRLFAVPKKELDAKLEEFRQSRPERRRKRKAKAL